jgi:uncharacterized protein
MKKTTLGFFIVIFLILAGLVLNIFFFKVIDIGGKKFIAQLALDPQSQEKGLGKRENLCENCAMLFDFKKSGNYAFWMKGMRFDLDILWISEGRITYIKKNFSKDSHLSIQPDVPADKVLEINAGLSDKYGFEAGDKVDIY